MTSKKAHELPQCQGHARDGFAACPLRVRHPRNGTKEFILGCGLCRGQHQDF